MKIVTAFFKNLLGVIFFLAVTIFVSLMMDYLSPKLIILGWKSYFGIAFIASVVQVVIQMFFMSVFFPIVYLINSKSSKIICILIAIFGFIYSVTTPWQYANVIGYRFIVIVWCISLTIFISGLFFGFLFMVLAPSEKYK